MACPDENDLLAYVEGDGPDDRRASIEHHLAACESCLSVVASFVGDDDAVPGSSWPDHRYTSRSLIGSGAHGVVYRAFDERLQRPVALKIVPLRPDAPETEIFREARVLASISHPNIVTVHDAGLHDGRLAVVMELVEGSDLSTWLQGPGRQTRWRHRLGIMLAAGRGLAAVHHAGVVHGDFKPANLLLGADDRVRVGDFGMSSLSAAGHADAEHGWGTPRYMAPERFRGEASVSADIYAFCASVYEALYLVPAYEATTLEALYARKCEGPPEVPSTGPSVPGFVSRAIARGLSAAPEQRWASMDELLGALGRAQTKRWPWVATTIVSLGVGAAAVTWAGADEAACDPDASPIATVWNPSQRAELEQAFASNPWPLRAKALQGVMPRLESYAAAWSSAHHSVCEAEARDELEQRAYRGQMTCLSTRLYAFDAALQVLSRPEPAVAERAISLVVSLPEIAECSLHEEADAQRPEVAASRRQLAEVGALVTAGLYAEAQAKGEAVLASVRELGDQRLLAEALLELGAASQHLEETAVAREQLEEAVWTAQAVAHPKVQIDAASLLATLESSDADRPEDGRRWIRYARAQIEASGASPRMRAQVARQAGAVAYRSGEREVAAHEARAGLALLDEAGLDAPNIRAALHGNLAFVLLDQGRLDEAVGEQLEVLQIREALYGPQHPVTARTLTNLGTTRMRQGELGEAEAMLRRAVEAREVALGPHSLDLAKSTNNLGTVFYTQGRIDEALALFERTLEIRRRTLPDHHRLMLRVRGNVALCLLELGRLDEAIAELEALISIIESRPQGQREMLPHVLGNLALAKQQRGELEDAAALHERAMRALAVEAGPSHPTAGTHRTNLADVLVALGRIDEARRHFEIALEDRTRILGPEHPDLARTLCGLASTYARKEDAETVRGLLERAAALAAFPDTPPEVFARVEFSRAEAALRFDDDAAAAMRHAQLARRALEGLQGARGELGDVEAFIEALGGEPE